MRDTTICGPLDVRADLDDVRLEPGAPGSGARRAPARPGAAAPPTAAEVEQRVAAVGLLDDAGDDVALAARRTPRTCCSRVGLADALGHHLAGGHGRRCGRSRSGVTSISGPYGSPSSSSSWAKTRMSNGVGVDRDPGVLVGARHPLVGRLQGVGEGTEERLDRDPRSGGEGREGLPDVERVAAHRCGLLPVVGGAPHEHRAGPLDLVVADGARGAAVER